MLCESMPKIAWFENDNRYSESDILFHYIMIPDVKNSIIEVKIWHGEYCYEKSLDSIVSERSFPLTTDGLREAVEYLIAEDRAFAQ